MQNSSLYVDAPHQRGMSVTEVMTVPPALGAERRMPAINAPSGCRRHFKSVIASHHGSMRSTSGSVADQIRSFLLCDGDGLFKHFRILVGCLASNEPSGHLRFHRYNFVSPKFCANECIALSLPREEVYTIRSCEAISRQAGFSPPPIWPRHTPEILSPIISSLPSSMSSQPFGRECPFSLFSSTRRRISPLLPAKAVFHFDDILCSHCTRDCGLP